MIVGRLDPVPQRKDDSAPRLGIRLEQVGFGPGNERDVAEKDTIEFGKILGREVGLVDDLGLSGAAPAFGAVEGASTVRTIVRRILGRATPFVTVNHENADLISDWHAEPAAVVGRQAVRGKPHLDRVLTRTAELVWKFDDGLLTGRHIDRFEGHQIIVGVELACTPASGTVPKLRKAARSRAGRSGSTMGSMAASDVTATLSVRPSPTPISTILALSPILRNRAATSDFAEVSPPHVRR